MPFRGRSLSRRMPRRTVVATVIGLSLALSASSVQATVLDDGARGRTSRPGVQDDGDPAKGRDARSTSRPSDPAHKAAVKGLDKAVWPHRGGAEVALGATTEAGGLPVTVGAPAAKPKAAKSAAAAAPAPGKVRVDVLDPARAARLGAGVLLGVARADGGARSGKVRLSVDYSRFAEGFGGSYASRCGSSSSPRARPSPRPAARTARSSRPCSPRSTTSARAPSPPT